MNILLFVMTMLMLLTMMTYGRMESYRGFAFVQTQFKEYMEKTERNQANKEAKERYDDSHNKTKEDENSEGKIENENQGTGRNPASPTLSFNLFIDKEEREKHAADLATQIDLAKNLMQFLYGDQPFFIEMQEKHPDFMDQILNALITVTSGYTKKEKLNTQKTEELATVDLGDIELNSVFTKMLRGSNENVEDNTRENTAFKPEHGYYSLLDFITIARNKLKLRVFLASPQVLMAIYGNVDTVNQILAARKNFYDEVKGGGKPEKATQEFQQQFQGAQLPSVPASILDFGVSKTRPQN